MTDAAGEIGVQSRLAERDARGLRQHGALELGHGREVDGHGEERPPPLEVLGAESREDLRRALARIPDKKRDVVMAVYVGGLTYEEAAQATGIPLGTLKRYLRDGLAQLRIELGEFQGAYDILVWPNGTAAPLALAGIKFTAAVLAGHYDEAAVLNSDASAWVTLLEGHAATRPQAAAALGAEIRRRFGERLTAEVASRLRIAEQRVTELTSAPTRAEVTGVGAVIGTAAYMSPEQVRGAGVDYRSDVFSFGCVLYEATTGARPFVAETPVETMHKILHDKPPPIEEKNPSCPTELRRLIRRCLAKSPEQRVQSMKDLAIELREIVDE